MVNRIKSLLFRYSLFLENKPYKAHSITACCLWFTGDMLCQYLEHTSLATGSIASSSNEPDTLSKDNDTKPSSFKPDMKRVGIMSLFGLAIAGPSYAFWYRLLDRRLTDQFLSNIVTRYFTRQSVSSSPSAASSLTPHTKKLRLTIAKMMADFMIFDPLFLTTFFASTTFLSTLSLEQTRSKLQQELLHAYLTEIQVWAPIQFVNFRFVNVNWQPVVINMGNIGWNAYLSHIQSK